MQLCNRLSREHCKYGTSRDNLGRLSQKQNKRGWRHSSVAPGDLIPCAFFKKGFFSFDHRGLELYTWVRDSPAVAGGHTHLHQLYCEMHGYPYPRCHLSMYPQRSHPHKLLKILYFLQFSSKNATKVAFLAHNSNPSPEKPSLVNWGLAEVALERLPNTLPSLPLYSFPPFFLPPYATSLLLQPKVFRFMDSCKLTTKETYYYCCSCIFSLTSI